MECGIVAVGFSVRCHLWKVSMWEDVTDSREEAIG